MSEEKNRRIGLTVSDELNEVLDRISVAYGKPKATIIVDILNDAMPSLKKIATVSEKLAAMKEGAKNLFGRAPHGTD